MSVIQSIRTLQQSGALDDALNACQTALNAHSDDAALLALLGVLHCQQGNFEQGRDCLQHLQAHTQMLNAEILTDIAAILLLLLEPVAALDALSQALNQQPDLYLAKARRGLVFMQLGRFTESMVDLQAVLPQAPQTQQAAMRVNAARCALYLNDYELALDYIEQAQLLGAVHLEQWLLVALDCYVALNRWEAAETVIHQALDANVDEIKCVKLLAFILSAQDKHDQASHTLKQTLKKYPDDNELRIQLATLARVQGHYGEVVRYIQAAIKIDPDNSSLWTQLAQLGKRHFDEQGAKRAAEKAISLTENDTGLKRAEALVAIASVTELESQAQAYYQQALALIPDYVPAYLGLGHLLLQWGRIDEAVTYFETVTVQHPIAGYGALINARRFPDDPQILERIEKIAYMPSLQGAVSSGLLFDLAAAWEHRKDYAKAFHFVNQANAANRKRLPYSAQKHSQHCTMLRRTFNAEFMKRTQNYGHHSSLPTFVLGMPRSGTTLVEQILGGHQDIFVAGEIAILSNTIQKLNAWERHIGSGQVYPECVRDLTLQQAQYFANEVLNELRQYAPDARYIVDKLPHNFEHIGLIRLLFPNAPIIHVLREPRDVAVSNYFTDYQAKFGGMGFAYDLTDIGWQLRDHQALMRHWDSVLHKPILTIRYEDVVADTETAAQKILAYLELDWTDSVLNYQNLERAVKTASVWQVRQPIYNTSTEKWRRYADFLQPLEAVLNAPLNDEILEPLDESLPAGYFFQGMSCLHAGETEQAAGIFSTILQSNPNHAAALHMLAITHYQQGNAKTALPLLQQAINQQPRHASWYANLSIILNALGKKKQAKVAYDKSQNLKTLQIEQDDFWRTL
ncbi:MAG: sulfotransferase [Methylococcaceae bacterium]